jgi:murein tripeptide amidase MpaA
VAALTIPALVVNYQEKATITKLKKIYSAMSQAYAQALTEDGDPAGWDLIKSDSKEGAANFISRIEPYLKTASSTSEHPYGATINLADGS